MRYSDAAINCCIGLFFALLSLFFLLVLNKYGIGIPALGSQAEASAVLPDFFPNMICGCVLFFSFGLIGTNIRGLRGGDGVVAAAVDTSKVEGGMTARLSAMATLIALYYVADFLGIVISGFIFYLLFALFTGERRPLRALVGATLCSLILYYFFVKVASVPLPLGVLSDILI
jgi:hypothetical protein